jgi:hypothetical protein
MTLLPAHREGPPPRWPLGRPSKIESETWAELWTLPQAAAWERSQSTRVVARYCQLLLKAEFGNVLLMPEVRMLEDRLGLSPMAMLRLRWEVAADEVDEKRQTKTATPRRRATKRRLMAVDAPAQAG